MAHMTLFHHVLGLTEGVHAFAEELRRGGHTVVTPDLYGGQIFTSIEDGSAHADSIGMEALLAAGEHLGQPSAESTVFAGFSLGALIAHKLAQTSPRARGALLYHYGDVPMSLFGDVWPAGVAVDIHVGDSDPWREPGVVEGFIAAVEPSAPAAFYDYQGAAHLFTDSTSEEYDADATALVIERTKAFLTAVDN